MTLTLKLFLIITLLFLGYLIIHKVNNQDISMRYSCTWLVMIFILIILALFPQIAMYLANILGFEKSSNMIFLISIIVLFYISFIHTITISKQNEKIKDLVQEISILKKEDKK